MFEVCLLKNTSGLGFSFSREENIPDESPGTSMVRVKKLFPGQPAAESGRINVGDVIMRVNQTALKGLSQHVRRHLILLRLQPDLNWGEKRLFDNVIYLDLCVCLHIGGDISLKRNRSGGDFAPL